MGGEIESNEMRQTTKEFLVAAECDEQSRDFSILEG